MGVGTAANDEESPLRGNRKGLFRNAIRQWPSGEYPPVISCHPRIMRGVPYSLINALVRLLKPSWMNTEIPGFADNSASRPPVWSA